MAFFHTITGKRYYEETLPAIVRELTRLNDVLELLLHTFAEPRAPLSPSTAAEEEPR